MTVVTTVTDSTNKKSPFLALGADSLMYCFRNTALTMEILKPAIQISHDSATQQIYDQQVMAILLSMWAFLLSLLVPCTLDYKQDPWSLREVFPQRPAKEGS